ncbi:L,D-transpeptidase family protein [Nocardioides sp.]|uniref:L,D-transpeptidase family protein n=1 Tax=Nocardioides sp. TaxID=35761 RepID=UPI002716DE2B|nr:L,D-transpeptidase family protein [Nocardioides sp.]MDO9456162.1 L,D-transpeptidase family protein [Nocardioides sp.]
MSRHRGTPPPRYQTRYGRVVVLGVSLLTTAIALLGGVGVLPSAADDDSDRSPDAVVAADLTQVAGAGADEAAQPPAPGPTAGPGQTEGPPAADPTSEPTDEPTDEPTEDSTEESDTSDSGSEAALPSDSGEGKRVVFSEDEQRVWLVGEAGKVKRTYLVSGSLTDNLDPGTFQVYSRSEDAVGIDDSGTMKWFVRFTQGPSGAAIGFHTIPVDDGQRVQTKADLGTPQSHGCIRQDTPDAKALWAFAPLGTTVVVV